TAWLYGCSSVNCSLLGIGERCGNTPLEAMVMEYAALRGTTDGMDTTVITEIADYYRNEIGYDIPPMTPFVGEHFNMTRAGIHADGLLKDEEIYNIFDTKKILNRGAAVSVSATSGLAGIAYWINDHYRPRGNARLGKSDPLVQQVKDWVDLQYSTGRQTVISTRELELLIESLAPGRFASQSR
ncbi:MAG: 2-isopropylmalate synthase, partial [Clostridia bacterium]|nr:2-isopropylmalate synthase [Clostridia bacterium]